MELHEYKAPRYLYRTLLALVAVYIALNILFFLSCEPTGGVCASLRPPEWMQNFVPAISKPTNYLNMNGNAARAQLVAAVYFFSWVSGIATAVVMLLATVTIIGLLKESDIRPWISAADRRAASLSSDLRDKANLGKGIFWFAIVLGLSDAYFGFFDFSGRLYFHNTVTRFDRDLFRMTFDWSGVLLFSLIFFGLLAQRIARKRLAGIQHNVRGG